MYPVFDEEAVLVSVCILYPVCSLQSAVRSLHFILTDVDEWFMYMRKKCDFLFFKSGE